MMTTQDPKPVGASIPDALLKRLEARVGADTGPVDVSPTETPAEAQERLQAAQAVFQARWAQRLPVMYATATTAEVLEDRDHLTAEYAHAIQSFRAGGALNLVLAGPLGTGKTHLAYALGNEVVRQGVHAEAWTVTDLLEAMRPNGDARVADDVRRCQLLILDDLGANKPTEWAVEQLTALLDTRIRESRQTVVTTNVPEPALEDAWGGRFLDRLRFRRAVAVFHGESRRKAAW